jgi:hypothetical protein
MLSCGCKFCLACVTDWYSRSAGRQLLCPLCFNTITVERDRRPLVRFVLLCSLFLTLFILNMNFDGTYLEYYAEGWWSLLTSPSVWFSVLTNLFSAFLDANIKPVVPALRFLFSLRNETIMERIVHFGNVCQPHYYRFTPLSPSEIYSRLGDPRNETVFWHEPNTNEFWLKEELCVNYTLQLAIFLLRVVTFALLRLRFTRRFLYTTLVPK